MFDDQRCTCRPTYGEFFLPLAQARVRLDGSSTKRRLPDGVVAARAKLERGGLRTAFVRFRGFLSSVLLPVVEGTCCHGVNGMLGPRFRSLHAVFRTVLWRFWRSFSAAVLLLMLLYWLYGGFVMLFLLTLALCGAFYHFQVC